MINQNSYPIYFRLKILQKLHVSVNNTQVTFYGGLFDIIEHCMLHTKGKFSTLPSSVTEAAIETSKINNAPTDVEHAIERLIPDLMIIHVENTEVKSLNKHNSYHYHLLLHRVEVKGRFKSSDASRMKISNLRIYTPAQEVLHSKELVVDIKSSGNAIVFGTKLDTLCAVYNHEDIYGWFLKIVLAGMKSNRKELIVRAFKMANEMMIEFYHSEFTQRLFRRFIINQEIELRNSKIILQLVDQVSSINISKLKFHLNQSEKLRRRLYEDYTMNLIFQQRHWSVEFIIDSPVCWFMDQKYDYLSNDSMKTYIRDSALYVGSTFLRLCSHGDAFKLDLRVNTIRTEYSQKLTAFVVKSISGSKEYVDLFSQLNSDKSEVSSVPSNATSIEDLLQSVTIDAKVSNISCFFINRHEVCIFLNLAEISSKDSYNYVLDTLQVSKVDLSKYSAVCNLSELSSIYISTKLLKLNLFASNDLPQVGVDFVEKLEVSWNAHFLRHLLSLARDFHRFKRSVEDALGITREQKSLLPRSLPVGLDIKKIRNIRIKHSDVNVDKLMLLINELSGENLFFYHYFH